MINQKLEFVEEEHSLILKLDNIYNKDESNKIISKFVVSIDPFNITSKEIFKALF